MRPQIRYTDRMSYLDKIKMFSKRIMKVNNNNNQVKKCRTNKTPLIFVNYVDLNF